jgi:hypothetical protein
MINQVSLLFNYDLYTLFVEVNWFFILSFLKITVSHVEKRLFDGLALLNELLVLLGCLGVMFLLIVFMGLLEFFIIKWTIRKDHFVVNILLKKFNKHYNYNGRGNFEWTGKLD